MTPRTQARWHRDRPTTRHCEARGCGVATRAGKPFCSEHVERHPYVQSLLDLMAESDLETERVGRQGARAVDVDGLNAREILQFVRVNGERTVARLARDLNMHLPTLRSYVQALRRARLLSLGKNKRGKPLIRIPGEKRRAAASVVVPAQPLAPSVEGDADAA
jgi:hypothetical protein